MQVIDLSHTIEAGMPVYPGTEPPVIDTPLSIEADGYQEKRLCFYSHTGTHIDAPAHIIEGASSLDQMMVDRFAGSGFIVDLTASGHSVIQPEDLTTYTAQFEALDFALFCTGWSAYWGQAKYFSGYPVLSEPAADWICRHDLKGIGIDTCSFDPVEDSDYPIHQIFLNRGLLLIENLTNLSGVPSMPFTFYCLPLKIKAADGSPVRAVAVLA